MLFFIVYPVRYKASYPRGSCSSTSAPSFNSSLSVVSRGRSTLDAATPQPMKNPNKLPYHQCPLFGDLQNQALFTGLPLYNLHKTAMWRPRSCSISPVLSSSSFWCAPPSSLLLCGSTTPSLSSLASFGKNGSLPLSDMILQSHVPSSRQYPQSRNVWLPWPCSDPSPLVMLSNSSLTYSLSNR